MWRRATGKSSHSGCKWGGRAYETGMFCGGFGLSPARGGATSERDGFELCGGEGKGEKISGGRIA